MMNNPPEGTENAQGMSFDEYVDAVNKANALFQQRIKGLGDLIPQVIKRMDGKIDPDSYLSCFCGGRLQSMIERWLAYYSDNPFEAPERYDECIEQLQIALHDDVKLVQLTKDLNFWIRFKASSGAPYEKRGPVIRTRESQEYIDRTTEPSCSERL